ncbi:MAG TPA: PKD domain-containing protein, partial [candidate division WOR-3 bacterium]|nr:PKD domain-containing protein [candidate division WOR-3 bacterium]
MHRVVSILIILTLIFTFTPAVGLRQPVGIAGYVYFQGQPVQGATVVVTNLATGENDSAITDSNGIFTASLYGADGDIIEGVAVYDNQTGSNQVVVDLNLTTQWLNISIGGGLVARFSYYPPNPRPNEPVHFYDRSDGNIVAWLWNFGDGTTGTGKNPTHTYTQEGTFTITLEIRDANNNFDRTQR